MTCGWILGHTGFSTDQAGVHKNITSHMTKYLTRGFLNVLLRPEIAILDKEEYSFFRAFVYGFRGSGSRATITRCNLLIGQEVIKAVTSFDVTVFLCTKPQHHNSPYL